MTLCETAKLYINDDHVGDVIVQGTDGSWSYGEFQPRQAFAPFAPLFGEWSLMMHACGAYQPLDDAVRTELRRVECGIDRLNARLDFRDRCVTCAQLNIDGLLIEWKSMEAVPKQPATRPGLPVS